MFILDKRKTNISYIFTIDKTNKTLYNILIATNKVLVLNRAASVRKENIMDEMTNEQFRTVLEMIIQIIKDNDKETAIKKIEALVNKD